MPTALTTRDREILDSLTRRVRVLTLEQVGRTWWKDSSPRAAERRLRALEEAGLVTLSRELAHPELSFEAPIVTWTPEEDEPNLGSVSFKIQSRWREQPRTSTCVSATPLAVERFGGYGGRGPRAVELTHDIHLTRVFLLHRNRSPELISSWVFEEQVKSERRRTRTTADKLPDAFLRLDSGPRVVEFGGAYDKKKLEAFHRYCADNAYPYEIW